MSSNRKQDRRTKITLGLGADAQHQKRGVFPVKLRRPTAAATDTYQHSRNIAGSGLQNLNQKQSNSRKDSTSNLFAMNENASSNSGLAPAASVVVKEKALKGQNAPSSPASCSPPTDPSTIAAAAPSPPTHARPQTARPASRMRVSPTGLPLAHRSVVLSENVMKAAGGFPARPPDPQRATSRVLLHNCPLQGNELKFMENKIVDEMCRISYAQEQNELRRRWATTSVKNRVFRRFISGPFHRPAAVLSDVPPSMERASSWSSRFSNPLGGDEGGEGGQQSESLMATAEMAGVERKLLAFLYPRVTTKMRRWARAAKKTIRKKHLQQSVVRQATVYVTTLRREIYTIWVTLARGRIFNRRRLMRRGLYSLSCWRTYMRMRADRLIERVEKLWLGYRVRRAFCVWRRLSTIVWMVRRGVTDYEIDHVLVPQLEEENKHKEWTVLAQSSIDRALERTSRAQLHRLELKKYFGRWRYYIAWCRKGKSDEKRLKLWRTMNFDRFYKQRAWTVWRSKMQLVKANEQYRVSLKHQAFFAWQRVNEEKKWYKAANDNADKQLAHSRYKQCLRRWIVKSDESLMWTLLGTISTLNHKKTMMFAAYALLGERADTGFNLLHSFKKWRQFISNRKTWRVFVAQQYLEFCAALKRRAFAVWKHHGAISWEQGRNQLGDYVGGLKIPHVPALHFAQNSPMSVLGGGRAGSVGGGGGGKSMLEGADNDQDDRSSVHSGGGRSTRYGGGAASLAGGSPFTAAGTSSSGLMLPVHSTSASAAGPRQWTLVPPLNWPQLRQMEGTIRKTDTKANLPPLHSLVNVHSVYPEIARVRTFLVSEQKDMANVAIFGTKFAPVFFEAPTPLVPHPPATIAEQQQESRLFSSLGDRSPFSSYCIARMCQAAFLFARLWKSCQRARERIDAAEHTKALEELHEAMTQAIKHPQHGPAVMKLFSNPSLTLENVHRDDDRDWHLTVQMLNERKRQHNLAAFTAVSHAQRLGHTVSAHKPGIVISECDPVSGATLRFKNINLDDTIRSTYSINTSFASAVVPNNSLALAAAASPHHLHSHPSGSGLSASPTPSSFALLQQHQAANNNNSLALTETLNSTTRVYVEDKEKNDPYQHLVAYVFSLDELGDYVQRAIVVSHWCLQALTQQRLAIQRGEILSIRECFLLARLSMQRTAKEQACLEARKRKYSSGIFMLIRSELPSGSFIDLDPAKKFISEHLQMKMIANAVQECTVRMFRAHSANRTHYADELGKLAMLYHFYGPEPPKTLSSTTKKGADGRNQLRWKAAKPLKKERLLREKIAAKERSVTQWRDRVIAAAVKWRVKALRMKLVREACSLSVCRPNALEFLQRFADERKKQLYSHQQGSGSEAAAGGPRRAGRKRGTSFMGGGSQASVHSGTS